MGDLSSFVPAICPHDDCGASSSPDRPFFQRWGSYRAACRNHAVPRFRCRSCKRTFSRQTFRYDYRQKKPHLDPDLLQLFVSGVGIRQAGRVLGVTRTTVTRKFSRIGAHCRWFHDDIARGISGHLHLQFDELETFEHCRLSKPVTMGTLIEADTRFIIEQGNGAIRPGGRKSSQARRLIARHGVRPAESRACVAAIFRRGSARIGKDAAVVLTTDRKTSYVPIAKEFLGDRLRRHSRHSGKLPRGPNSPLFPINHTNAMWRDNLSRLRRRSWLASKKRSCLDLHAWIFVVYRNYIRPRFNGEAETPAQRLGLVGRALTVQDVLSWRHDLESGAPRCA